MIKQNTIISYGVKIDCQYASIKGTSFVFYDLTILEDNWELFKQNDELSRHLKGTCPLAHITNFIENPSINAYKKLYSDYDFTEVYITDISALEDIQNSKITFEQFIRDKSSIANEDFNQLVRTINADSTRIVYIPEQSQAQLILDLNKKCLWFDTLFYLPNFFNTDWDYKLTGSLLNTTTITSDKNSETEQFLNQFIDVNNNKNTFRKFKPYLSNLESKDSNVNAFYLEQGSLIDIPFYVNNTELYNIAWNTTTEYLKTLISPEEIDRFTLHFNDRTAYMASMLIFKIQQMDELLGLNFLLLFSVNLSQYEYEDANLFFEKAALNYLLNENLPEITFKKSNNKI